jgi:hypothetical protein
MFLKSEEAMIMPKIVTSDWRKADPDDSRRAIRTLDKFIEKKRQQEAKKKKTAK